MSGDEIQHLIEIRLNKYLLLCQTSKDVTDLVFKINSSKQAIKFINHKYRRFNQSE